MSNLIVTPEQYHKGYLVFLGGTKPYALIKRLADGNYLVKTPVEQPDTSGDSI